MRVAGEGVTLARRQAEAAREAEGAIRVMLVKALDVLEIDTGLETGALCIEAAVERLG